MTPASLQFGVFDATVVYRDRPAAFGIAMRDGHIAVVRVAKPGLKPWWDLPGGALDADEDDDQALVREFGEETGLVVRAGRLLTRADQFFRQQDGSAVNNRTGIYRAEVDGEVASLKIEDDHTLEWVEPNAALARLRHDSHAWAVACWLRLR